VDARARELAGKVKEGAGGVVDAAKSGKGPFKVQVDVDMLKPTLDTVRNSVSQAWLNVPPQARTAAPYAGVALASSAVTSSISGRFADQRARRRERKFRSDEAEWGRERELLEAKIQRLEAQDLLGGAGMAQLAATAQAVSQATQAAAAAASAAAESAIRCQIK